MPIAATRRVRLGICVVPRTINFVECKLWLKPELLLSSAVHLLHTRLPTRRQNIDLKVMAMTSNIINA